MHKSTNNNEEDSYNFHCMVFPRNMNAWYYPITVIVLSSTSL